ncbi:hypothetical protein AB0G02_17540, partial [Actinosynnema sp. NPDC023658]|uniref:hypothetical protein n=1 Tax=Actinosynnema sp. NPDC023658 TaxID=3155465 RepID=UPI00340BBE18
TTGTRLGTGPLRLLPQAVPVVLLLAVALAAVWPGGTEGGPYPVDTPGFAVVDGSDCARGDVLTTCTAPVAGQRSTVPWWRDALGLWWDRVLLVAIAVFALLTGLAAFLLHRAPRLEDDDRVRRTVVTGVSSWVLPILTSLLVTARAVGDYGAVLVFVAVATAVPAGAMAAWQYLATGPARGRLRERVGWSAVAVLATLLFGSVQVLWVGLASGLLD